MTLKRFTPLLLLTAICFAAPPTPLSVELDGKRLSFPNAQPQTIKGRVMVPVRGIFESLGAYVEYNSTNKKVIARKANEDVELTIGDRLAKRAGAEILLDVPPMIIDGTTMVPLRFIAESLGASVQFIQAKNLVAITLQENPTGALPGGYEPPPSP